MAVLVPSPGNLGTFSAFLSCLHALSFLTANQHLLLFPKAALDLLEPAWLACAGSWLEVSGIYSPATLKDCRKHDSPCFTTQLSTILRGNSHSCTPSRIRPPSAGGGRYPDVPFFGFPFPFLSCLHTSSLGTTFRIKHLHKIFSSGSASGEPDLKQKVTYYSHGKCHPLSTCVQGHPGGTSTCRVISHTLRAHTGSNSHLFLPVCSKMAQSKGHQLGISACHLQHCDLGMLLK